MTANIPAPVQPVQSDDKKATATTTTTTTTTTSTTKSGAGPSVKEKRKKKTDPTAAALTVSVIPIDLEAEDAVDFEPQTVSVTSCLVVISSFVIGGAILFSIWEVRIVDVIHHSRLLLLRQQQKRKIDFGSASSFQTEPRHYRAGATSTDPIFVLPVC